MCSPCRCQRLQPVIEACQADESVLFNTIDWLRDRVKDLSSSMKASQAVINSSEREIALGEAALSTGSCTFCGQDFSHLPQVAEKNAQIQAKIDQHNLARQEAAEALASAEAEKRTLDGILTVSEARFATLDANPDYVARVGKDLPPKLYWTPDLDVVGVHARHPGPGHPGRPDPHLPAHGTVPGAG